MGRFFDTRRLITNGRLEFCGFVVCSEEEPNVCLVVIGADTTEEGDTVLWSQFLNQTSSINTYSHGRGKKRTLGRPQFFFNHSCSHRISASGRLAGSFWKHCLRKSSRRGETVSGMGGSVSSTIRNMTVHTTYQYPHNDKGSLKFSLTRHAVSDVGIWRSSGEQFNHGTSQ